jgi:hypothetical protein
MLNHYKSILVAVDGSKEAAKSDVLVIRRPSLHAVVD